VTLDGLAQFPFPRLDFVVAIVGADSGRRTAKRHESREQCASDGRLAEKFIYEHQAPPEISGPGFVQCWVGLRYFEG
jgi:hypothetical protein